MWTTVTRQLSFNGTVAAAIGGGTNLPLRGVLVDVYRAYLGSDGTQQFQRLNQAAALTSPTGDFAFGNLPVPVQIEMLTPATPPYTPVEFLNVASLPTLVFRVSVDAEVIGGATAAQQIVDVYDERPDVDAQWLFDHPDRVRVPLSGGPVISMVIPEGDPEAMIVAGMTASASPAPPGKEFHFLRVGRAIRAEIGELGDTGDFANRAGYMISTDLQSSAQPSFFGGVRDAPFGGQLHVGGRFGTLFDPLIVAETLYYSISVCTYGGSLTSAFDPSLITSETPVTDPLFNKRYRLPVVAPPNGQWQTFNLGPFNGTITAVESSHPATLVGSTVSVYKRPPLPTVNDYWPFWDLMAIWSSAAAPNETIILKLEAYERTAGGSDTAPNLIKLNMDHPAIQDNSYLPLTIDNRAPVLHLSDWETGVANFALKAVSAIGSFGSCGEMPVTTPQTVSNECILLRYSIEDGDGNPHRHVAGYSLGIRYTPKQVTGAPLEDSLLLHASFGGYDPISGSYSALAVGAPHFEVMNKQSVLLPQAVDGWPPEQAGDPTSGGSQCIQYALAVGATCSVRTVDGWGAAFGDPGLNRHIIIRRS